MPLRDPWHSVSLVPRVSMVVRPRHCVWGGGWSLRSLACRPEDWDSAAAPE